MIRAFSVVCEIISLACNILSSHLWHALEVFYAGEAGMFQQDSLMRLPGDIEARPRMV